MKRKIALMMSSVLLCAAIFGGCATYDAVDTAFTAFNDGNIEKAQKVYADKIKKDCEKKDSLEQLLSDNLEQILLQYNNEEITDEQAEAEMDKYVQTFDGLDSVDSASVHLQELIDSKMSFKKAKEYQDKGGYGSAYTFYSTVIDSDSNYNTAQEQMQQILRDLEQKSYDLCEEGKYGEAITRTISIMNAMGIKYPMENQGIMDFTFLMVAEKLAESCGFENAQASLETSVANAYYNDLFYDFNIGCSSLNGVPLENVSDKMLIEAYQRLHDLVPDTFVKACMGSGFHFALGDIHSDGKWYDVFIAEGCESSVTIRSTEERKEFNEKMRKMFGGKTQDSDGNDNKTTTNKVVTQEYRNALNKGLEYAKGLHMSKKGIYEQLTSPYGEQFPADAAQYAIDNMTGVDWNANALAKAKDYYYTFSMSKSGVYEQLVSEYGEQFTESEAQYAIDHLED